MKRHSASSFIWEVSTETEEALPDELKLKFQVNYGQDMIFEDTPFDAHFDFKDFKVSFITPYGLLKLIFLCIFRLCIYSSVVSIPLKGVANYARLPVSVLCLLAYSRSTTAVTHP